MYDGGQGVDNCTFLNYPNPSEHGKVHSAIGIRLYNVDQMATVNRASKCSFVNVTNPIYFIDRGADGGKTSNLKDVDGSISGTSGAHILPDTDFYKTFACRQGNSWVACPHKYVQLWVLDMTHATDPSNNLILTRNQHTTLTHTSYQVELTGFPDWGVWRYQPIVSLGASYLLSFRKLVPERLVLQLVNAFQDNTVPFAICYPRGTQIISVRTGLIDSNGYSGIPSSNGGSTLPAASSRSSPAVLDGSHYYFDTSRSLLFVTPTQNHERTQEKMFCPLSGCNYLYIQASIPSGAQVGDCTSVAYSGGDSLQVVSSSWLSQTF